MVCADSSGAVSIRFACVEGRPALWFSSCPRLLSVITLSRFAYVALRSQAKNDGAQKILAKYLTLRIKKVILTAMDSSEMGRRGGKARAARMTPDQRRRAAVVAITARWDEYRARKARAMAKAAAKAKAKNGRRKKAA
jgi:hypothetical protein